MSDSYYSGGLEFSRDQIARAVKAALLAAGPRFQALNFMLDDREFKKKEPELAIFIRWLLGHSEL